MRGKRGKRGRKLMPLSEAKHAILSLRVTEDLRDYLQRVAAIAGRSMSREAELRLIATRGKYVHVNMPEVTLKDGDGEEEDIY